MTVLRSIGIAGRRGGAVAVGLFLATILGIGAAMYFGKENSDMEKDALRRTREVADNPRAPRAAAAAEEAVEKDTKQLQYDETRRVIGIIAPGGGPITDLVDFADQADEATRFYGQLLFGDNATNAQLAIAAQRAAAAKSRITRTNPDLAANRRLVAHLLHQTQAAEEQLASPDHIANLRQKFPKMYGNCADDAAVRDKYLRNQLSGTILRADRAYKYAQQELRHEGRDPSPAQVNAVVAKLFTGSKWGDNEEAFNAALAEVKARQNAYGAYQGGFTGQASGKCWVTVSRSGVKATFKGKGRTGDTGSFTVTVSGSGPYDPEAGSFSGKLSGSLTWVLPSVTVPLMGTSPVTGSYQGKVGAQGLSGSWTATSSGETRTGAFKARK